LKEQVKALSKKNESILQTFVLEGIDPFDVERAPFDPWMDRGAFHSVKRLTLSTGGSDQNGSDTMIEYAKQKESKNTSRK
jgi:hypothetical protein